MCKIDKASSWISRDFEAKIWISGHGLVIALKKMMVLVDFIFL